MSESNDKTIDEVTPDANVTGVERIPVSDGGVPKFATVDQIRGFVFKAISELQDAQSVDLDEDGVYLKKSGANGVELKPVGAKAFADAVVALSFGGGDAGDLDGADEIVIRRDGEDGEKIVKTTTVGEIASLVSSAVSGSFDIHGLDESELVGIDELPFYAFNDGENRKIKASDFIRFLVYNLDGGFEPEATEIDLDHECIVYLQGWHEGQEAGLRLGALSPRALLGHAGDVKAPSANTDGKIPTWDGANSKRLNNGLGVVKPIENPLTGAVTSSGISDQSSDTEIPTARAVNEFGKEIKKVAGNVSGPSSSVVNGAVAMFDGTDGKKIASTGATISSSMPENPGNSALLTAKAISDAIVSGIEKALSTTPGAEGGITTAIASQIAASIASLADGTIGASLSGKIDKSQTATAGNIPTWTTGHSLNDGMPVSTSVNSESTDSQIPTAKAVHSAISGVGLSDVVKCASSTTGVQGRLPKWSSADRTLDPYGYTVVDVVPYSGLSTEIPTTNAMLQSRGVMNTISNPPGDGVSGFKQFAFLLCTKSDDRAIYVNVGSDTSASWIKFVPAS